MNRLFQFLAVALISIASVSCHGVHPDAGQESVLIYKPWFFGHGGVDPEPVQTGFTWCAPTTDAHTFIMTPFKWEVNMDDLFSNDNTPLDFHTVVVTQIQKGKTPILLQNYGDDWFNNNVLNFYSNRVRDHVSQHSPFDLMSNREVLNRIDSILLVELRQHVKELSADRELPIDIKQVVIGKAIPNQEQLDEMNKTAKAVQARQTQEREAEVQLAREKAERQRAIADKAYQNEMGLSTQQFIQLKAWDIIASKNGANIDVLFNADGTTKMWNVK